MARAFSRRRNESLPQYSRRAAKACMGKSLEEMVAIISEVSSNCYLWGQHDGMAYHGIELEDAITFLTN